MPSSLILKTAALPVVERLVRGSFVFRPLVKRFIAGENLEVAMGLSEGLCEKDLSISLDYLGENTHSEAEALAAKQTYMQMLDRIAQSPYASRINISIKLTQCGLDQGEEFAERTLRDVLTKARERNNFIRVDMEGSAYTERTIRMMAKVWEDFQNTGTVIQSYLYRSAQDVALLNDLGMRVRLVKGAYLEPSEVAFPEKSKVDASYVGLAKQLMRYGNYPALATHDEDIISELKTFANDQNISKERFEWQMLYGIRRDLQESLRSEGYNVRVYVPFGDAWYPYFSRRLAERPANAFFIVKSLIHP